jgi:Clp amino terminal domain, pathogenicity island component
MTRLGALRLASAQEMFDGFSFSEPAREVVELAQDEARSLEHNWVGSEHLLLALGRAEEGVAAGVLGDLGIVPERVRDVMASGGARPQDTSAKLRFTPRANMVLSLALRETLAFGDSFVGTAHILLALTRVSEGRAARIMFDLGVDPGEVAGEVLTVRHAPTGSWRSGAWDEPMAAGSRPAATGGPQPLRATAVRAAVEVALWAAADHAREEHRDLDLGDLLLALAEGWPEDVVGRVLAQAGMDASGLREAVEAARRRGG